MFETLRRRGWIEGVRGRVPEDVMHYLHLEFPHETATWILDHLLNDTTMGVGPTGPRPNRSPEVVGTRDRKGGPSSQSLSSSLSHHQGDQASEA